MDQVICPICADTVSIPVIFKLLPCACRDKQRYCLTCIRDAMNMNGAVNGAGRNSLTKCPTCRAGLYIQPAGSKNNSDVYEIDEKLMNDLDKIEGTKCPRECEWTGFRRDLREHLQTCNNTFRFKCKGCLKIFNKAGLIDHIKHNMICRSNYHQCVFCQIDFIDDTEFEDHKSDCSGKLDVRCNKCHEFVINNKKELLEHLLSCSFSNIWI